MCQLNYYILVMEKNYIKSSNKKIPGCYALINSKYENSYNEILKSFKNIITNENATTLKIKSITSDFEKLLINAINKVFIGIRQVGCYFHFIKNNRLKMSKLGFFSAIYSEYIINILKDISLLPFNYDNNKNIIEDIFTNLDSENNENIVLLIMVKKYENYFIKNRKLFFENESLNYSCINKLQRTNNYLENYNKRLWDILCKNNYIYIYIIFIIYSTIYKK